MNIGVRDCDRPIGEHGAEDTISDREGISAVPARPSVLHAVLLRNGSRGGHDAVIGNGLPTPGNRRNQATDSRSFTL